MHVQVSPANCLRGHPPQRRLEKIEFAIEHEVRGITI